MFIPPPADTPATAQVYAASAASQGFTMNLTRAWAWRPDVYDGFAALRGQLTGASALSKRDLAVLVCAGAAELGDAYCSLAWSRDLARLASGPVAAAVIGNGDAADLTDRDRALAAWARRVVADPNATTAADVDALRRVGLGDREIVEATMFIGFRIAFSVVNDALGVPPDRELLQQAAPEVRAAVTFGRSPDA